jgi:thymidylate kinase
MARGAFIVIEGLDRSGKTTQTDLLSSHLSKIGLTIDRRKFPGEPKIIFFKLFKTKKKNGKQTNVCALRPSAQIVRRVRVN